jgi:glutathione S-transferase
MMKLFTMSGACSLATHITLIWADADFELAVVTHDDLAGEPFGRLNPKRVVPVLIVDDGSVLTESLAVLQYIAEMHPAARLGPQDVWEQARVNESLAYLVSDVHLAWAPVMVPGRYVTVKANEEDAKLAAFVQLDRHYQRMNDELADSVDEGDWMLFNRRTVVDAYLYVMCCWKDDTPTPLASFPALSAYKRRLDNDAGIQRSLREQAGS